MNHKSDKTEIQPIAEVNSYQERILKFRETDKRIWDNFDVPTRIAALIYEAGRREFIRLEELKTEVN